MSIGPHQLPPKKEVALALLEESSLFIYLDPRRTGVIVPPRFHKQPELILQVGLNMAVPIRDLEVNEDGITCTLSFSRSPFWCCLPWTAIYALMDEKQHGMIWPDDVPPEIMTDMLQRLAPMMRAAKRQRPKLSVVDGTSADTTSSAEQGESAKEGAETDKEMAEPSDENKVEGGQEAAAPQDAKAPALRAVPAPPAEDGAEAKKEDASEAPEAEKSESETPQGTKRKREIPPWLRVIK